MTQPHGAFSIAVRVIQTTMMKSPQHFSDGFSGQNMEEFTFDMEKHDIQMKMPWMITWNQLKWLSVKFMYENVYHPICIKVLRRYLNLKKNNVMRKEFLQQFLYFCVVKPRVRLMKKTLTDSQGLQISCLATGFYPRHINLTLFRDGQPVEDDQITGGEILPNGDGTYQMRKNLLCHVVEHASSHKPIIYYWDPSLEDFDRNKLIAGAAGLVFGVVIADVGLIYCKKCTQVSVL
uniref:Major histocompatibility complex class I LBA n=1 Tax=Sinocyclocheilus grahami TaxID=75366 RepID=A0A672MJL4_SINGR